MQYKSLDTQNIKEFLFSKFESFDTQNIEEFLFSKFESLDTQNVKEFLFHILNHSIHRNYRMALSQSKQFLGVLSAGKIHCLQRLRKEGSPDFLSRS